jgi:hypothetical protein
MIDFDTAGCGQKAEGTFDRLEGGDVPFYVLGLAVHVTQSFVGCFQSPAALLWPVDR